MAPAMKLTLYGGRSVKTAGATAIDVLKRSGAAGASVLAAVDGTRHRQRQRARFFARNTDVPLTMIAVGDIESLRSALPTLPGPLDDLALTVETVQVCKSDGRLLAEPQAVHEVDPTGLPIWQKLMIHSQAQAKVGGHPLHRELVRRLRAVGAAGATVLQGVRGFYGDHEPFADRFFQLRRNVPVHSVIIDTPSAVREWWPVVDELTRQTGLVTSELVRASHAFASDHAPRLKLASTPTNREQSG